jgi:SAM-dependent methyltransferase
MCLDILGPHVRDRDVLELGSGSGYFAFRLFERARPHSITCVDFSQEAIERGRKLGIEKYGAENILKFMVADITKMDMPSAYVTIGLGLLDYLNEAEISELFMEINSEYFLFTFPERVFSLLRILHFFYMKTQQCPKHYYYKKSDIKECCDGRFSGLKFINEPRLSFGCIVHNLPD